MTVEPEEDFSNREFLQGADLSNQHRCGRPPVPAGLDDRKDCIEFMQIDCDHYSIRPDQNSDWETPVIRLFGVTALGNSVAAHVHNFTAYFYVHIIEPKIDLSAEEVEKFRKDLCQRAKSNNQDAVI